MKQEAKKFDLTTHVRDAKGNIVRENPYRLTIINGVHEYERPPGSGYVYTAGGDLIRKPSAKQVQAQQAKEFSNDQLMKQIEELKAQLASAEAAPAVEVEEDIPEVPVGLADNSEEIALMEAAGASEDAKALAAVKPLFTKPSFLKQVKMAAVLVSPAQRANGTSGTELRLTAADVQFVIAIFLSVPAANTGSIFVGDSNVSTIRGLELPKGTNLRIDAPQGDFLDIYNMYFDAATTGDKLNVSYLVKVV